MVPNYLSISLSIYQGELQGGDGYPNPNPNHPNPNPNPNKVNFKAETELCYNERVFSFPTVHFYLPGPGPA